MGATKVSPGPDDELSFEIAYAGKLDVSESHRLVVRSALLDGGDSKTNSGSSASLETSDWDAVIETVVSLSFEGEVVR